jgi:methionine sulfoxide reductase heme-binding subunit
MATTSASEEIAWPRWVRWLGAHTAGRKSEPYPWIRAGLFLGALLPLASTILRAFTGQLSANPIAEIENELGLSALIFLVATMACSPARRVIGWTWPMRVRRQLGLWAFFYASAHFATYLLLDQFLDVNAIVADVIDRPFITAGFAAFVFLAPIAWTSSNDWVRKLGYMKWLRIHQLVYLAVPLAALHFFWRVKIDVSQPLTYAAIFGVLLGIRAWLWLRKPRAGVRTQPK